MKIKRINKRETFEKYRSQIDALVEKYRKKIKSPEESLEIDNVFDCGNIHFLIVLNDDKVLGFVKLESWPDKSVLIDHIYLPNSCAVQTYKKLKDLCREHGTKTIRFLSETKTAKGYENWFEKVGMNFKFKGHLFEETLDG